MASTSASNSEQQPKQVEAERATASTSLTHDIYTDENIDEKITAQQLEIEKEIANEQPLVSKKYSLGVILNEYLEDDAIYRNKINELSNRFQFIRKTRGDGNCFFRAFGFSYFESLIGKKEEIESLKSSAIKCAQDLVTLGYNSFTIDDFKDVFIEELEKLADEKYEVRSLESSFNDSGTSDYIVVFLRLIVSSYLQMNSEFYQSFIEGYPTIKEFCSHEVEPMYRESDHIHIIALTNAIKVPVGIIYLDRTEQETATPHNFPDDSHPNLFILYRPGHYDIIYKS